MEINQYTVVWQVINFFVLLFILRRFLFKPVFRVLDARRQQIEDALADAANKQAEAEELKKRYEAQIATQKEEADRLIVEAKRTGEQIKNEIVSDARKKATTILENAETEITAEKRRVMQSLFKDLADYSVDLTARLVKKTMDKTTHAKLVEEVITEAGETAWKV